MQTSQRFKLAPFERYMLLDESPAYPMTCHIRFWFEGPLDRQHFFWAVERVLSRHPLLSSFVNITNGDYFFDVVTPVLDDIIDWQEAYTDPTFQPQALPDLRLRMTVRSWNERSLVIVQFHHAVCDGIGIFGFFEEVLKVYDSLCKGNACTLPALDPAALTRRFSIAQSPRGWRKSLADMVRILKFFSQFASAIDLGPTKPLADHASLTAAERVVSANEMTHGLQSAAKKSHVTVNDVLLSELFYVLDTIPLTHHAGLCTKYMRISVATSVRTPDDSAMSAANLVSMVFLDRSRNHMQNKYKFLREIAAEMRQIREDCMGVAMLRCLSYWEWLSPRLTKKILNLPLCMATAVLTNLGRPFLNSSLMGIDGLVRAGDITLTGLDTLPPLRPKTRLAYSINSYGGSLSITMRYDSRFIHKEDAKKFLTRYAQRIESFSQEKSQEPYSQNIFMRPKKQNTQNC